MSIDLRFDRPITVKELKEKTDIDIVYVDYNYPNFTIRSYEKKEETDDRVFLTDKYENDIWIMGEIFDESFYLLNLCAGSNGLYILDTLVKKLGVRIMLEEKCLEFDYSENKNEEMWERMFDESMQMLGYMKDGKIIVPNRSESEYLPYRKRNEIISYVDDDLPF
jgi:hypothetical protein